MKGAIVLGGHIQALGIVRSLGQKEIPIFVVQSEIISISMFSRYVKKTFLSPSEYNERQYLHFLKNLSKENNFNKFTLFPTNDQQVTVLSKNYSFLSKYFKITVPNWPVTRKLINKKYTYQIANKLNINQPFSFFPLNLNHLEKKSDELNYPCIVKPAVMHTFFHNTKTKVFFCNDKTELIENYEKALNYIPQEEIIIQDYVPGDSNNLYSFCSFFKEGKSMYPLVGQRKRQHPIDFGNGTTFATTEKNTELQEVSNKLLKEIDFYGLSEVEFKKDDRDGKFRLLEVNARTWKWHSLGHNHDRNFPYVQYCDLNNKNLKLITKQSTEKISWIHITTDIFVFLQLLVKGLLSFDDYLKSIKGQIYFANLSKFDPVPFLAEILLLPYLLYKR